MLGLKVYDIVTVRPSPCGGLPCIRVEVQCLYIISAVKALRNGAVAAPAVTARLAAATTVAICAVKAAGSCWQSATPAVTGDTCAKCW